MKIKFRTDLHVFCIRPIPEHLNTIVADPLVLKFVRGVAPHHIERAKALPDTWVDCAEVDLQRQVELLAKLDPREPYDYTPGELEDKC